MQNIEILHILFYIILNYLGYSLVIIFKLLFLRSLPLIYHIIQLFFSNISIYLLIKIRSQNIYVSNTKPQTLESEKAIGEEDPIVQFNLMTNVRCEFCNIDKLPLRSHHCQICNKCVKCFDHHCWILAGCIGENNRFLFMIFLFLENCSIDCCLLGILKLLKMQKNEGLKYVLTFYFSFICIFSVIFLFIFIYHSYLFLTNQTNYELFNEDQCPYLIVFSFEKNKYLQQKGNDYTNNFGYRPFDLGMIKNFFLFFDQFRNKDKYDINWEEIYYENLKKTHQKKSCCDKN